MRRAIELLAVPAASITEAENADIEQLLVNFAHLRLDLVTTPAGLKLQRIINTESYRFPEIFMLYYDIAARPVIERLAQILAALTSQGRLALDEPTLAANIFISMVASGPVRSIVAGNALAPAEVEHRIRYAARLFLYGAMARG